MTKPDAWTELKGWLDGGLKRGAYLKHIKSCTLVYRCGTEVDDAHTEDGWGPTYEEAILDALAQVRGKSDAR